MVYKLIKDREDWTIITENIIITKCTLNSWTQTNPTFLTLNLWRKSFWFTHHFHGVEILCKSECTSNDDVCPWNQAFFCFVQSCIGLYPVLGLSVCRPM
jgi:hypothetical protein